MTDENENLLIHAPCGIFSYREDGVITMANTYCCNLLEYDQEELIGKNISALLTLAGKIFYQTHFYPLVKLHQHAEEIFLNLVSKSKKDIPIVLNAVITLVHNQPMVVCSFIQVLNRRKYEDEILLAKKNAEDALRKNEALEKIKAELELQQKELDQKITQLQFQNRELIQLGNIVTHDLQEPVRKLILFTNELLTGELEATKQDRALSVIKKSSQRIKSLLLNLQDYLNLTLPSAHKQVNLDEVIRYELQQLQQTFSQVELQLEIAPLPVIAASESQLHLLFHHLLKNAFVHGTTNNKLTLRITAVIVKENLFNSLQHKYTYVDYVKVTISDCGQGFESHYNDYIFDVVRKLNLKDESAGFGLAFCRKIAENHFGNIKAEGTKGVGACFTVTLPISSL